MANFFALFWGWADYEPKDWSEAAYKSAYASSGESLNFLFRSGAGLTMSRRIGRAPRISENIPRDVQARFCIEAPSSIYRRARSPHWIKVKNPSAPAVKRSAEEDWGSRPTGEVSKR
jgi:hypothetical protein